MQYSETANSKIKKFIQDGVDKLHIIADFDRTLTQNLDHNINATTYGIIKSYLPRINLHKYQVLYDKYRKKELAGTMTLVDAINWWEKSLDLIVGSKLNWDNIKKDISNELLPKKGVVELFAITQKNQIPVIIISAGIKNVIDHWCTVYGFNPSLVLSTEIELDEHHKFARVKKNTLIHCLNKNEPSQAQASQVKKQRPNVILLGDSLDDVNMTDGTDTVLRIFIDNLHKDELKLRHKTHSQQVAQLFDIHLLEDDLSPVVNLLQQIDQVSK